MPSYVEVPYTAYLPETLSLLEKPGLLLVAAGRDGKPNAMTIGWGTVGVIWGRPLFLVLVRPSRHTFGLLNESVSFTVCVPSHALFPAVDFCGTKSGRDVDKFAQCSLESLPSLKVNTPAINGCPIIYECRIMHVNDVMPDNLAGEIVAGSYPQGDFHRIYFGQIMAVRALVNARQVLGSSPA